MVIIKFGYLCCFFSCLVLCHSQLKASPDDDFLSTIAKARAAVGHEDSINGLNSLHYFGRVLTSNALSAENETDAVIEIIFQKPYRQLTIISGLHRKEITGLDNNEAWQVIKSDKEGTREVVTLLTPEQVKRLRANSWETFAYFKDIELIGGSVKYFGQTEFLGQRCIKILFQHDAKISYMRYFEPDTGRLLFTEAQNGALIFERGTLFVAGLRFPREIVSRYIKDNKVVFESRVVFSRIVVNESFDDSIFRLPTAN